MPSRFLRFLESLSFRFVVLATLLIIGAFFVIRPNIHGSFCKDAEYKNEECVQDKEKGKIFFGLSPEGWTAILMAGLFVATVALLKWSGLKAWATKVAQRQGNKRATVALARKMVVLMLRMWVDGTTFRWTKVEAAIAA